jgi:hypothetical protein
MSRASPAVWADRVVARDKTIRAAGGRALEPSDLADTATSSRRWKRSRSPRKTQSPRTESVRWAPQRIRPITAAWRSDLASYRDPVSGRAIRGNGPLDHGAGRDQRVERRIEPFDCADCVRRRKTGGRRGRGSGGGCGTLPAAAGPDQAGERQREPASLQRHATPRRTAPPDSSPASTSSSRPGARRGCGRPTRSTSGGAPRSRTRARTGNCARAERCPGSRSGA